MTITDLQHLIGATPDGKWGALSKAALLAHFSGRPATPLSSADLAGACTRLGCSILQLQAVRAVESSGRGFDGGGRPKILFERHKFHKFTGGRFSPAPFSLAQAGGYDVNSWTKLADAIGTGAVDAAFMACSWGAFQIMGEWWDECLYASPYALAHACAQDEAGQLQLLIKYVEHFALQDELKQLTSNPETCRPFAAAYNGPRYAVGGYHVKLAERMAA
ncbi:N-acetylmuramidase domain-containing protein [Novosphingobium sp. FKTRR1]|uniref:N-acetylmuramidase domain-containing protein n=1 Tax=Novosphingobium sp. FKTRR1 TaxID=2879118 RepID=UPI001CF04BB9|nr:N-acetylmuramidase domain-containing protein [Novosphingobium sp. FKTRR1]